MALFPRLPGRASTRKVKPIWILLEQETVSGSGISWATCKSASRSRHLTMPAPTSLSFLQAGCPSCHPTNSVKALKATGNHIHRILIDVRTADRSADGRRSAASRTGEGHIVSPPRGDNLLCFSFFARTNRGQKGELSAYSPTMTDFACRLRGRGSSSLYKRCSSVSTNFGRHATGNGVVPRTCSSYQERQKIWCCWPAPRV